MWLLNWNIIKLQLWQLGKKNKLRLLLLLPQFLALYKLNALIIIPLCDPPLKVCCRNPCIIPIPEPLNITILLRIWLRCHQPCQLSRYSKAAHHSKNLHCQLSRASIPLILVWYVLIWRTMVHRSLIWLPFLFRESLMIRPSTALSSMKVLPLASCQLHVGRLLVPLHWTSLWTLWKLSMGMICDPSVSYLTLPSPWKST